MAIESDVRGADENLYAEFYVKPVKQNFASEEAGRPIFADVVYVKIMTPSDQLTQIDTIAREDHKARFPRQWAYFQNKQAGMQQVVGTPVGEVVLIVLVAVLFNIFLPIIIPHIHILEMIHFLYCFLPIHICH